MPRSVFGDWWPEQPREKTFIPARALTQLDGWWYKTFRRWLILMLSINNPPPAPKPWPAWLKVFLITVPIILAVAGIVVLCIKTGLG